MPLTLHGPHGSWGLRALLDTGAGRTMIPPHAARRVGLRLDDSRALRIVAVTGGAALPLARADAVSALGLVRRDLEVVVFDLPASLGFEAILGIDYLTGYRTCIDFGAGTIDMDRATNS